MPKFASIDYIVIAVFILGIVLIGMYQGKKHQTSSDFFLAGRNVPWYMIGYSIFASNISAEHLVGLAGAGYMFGLLHGNYEWLAFGSLLLLAFIFLPYYLKTEVVTMPEFLEKRFDKSSRNFLAVLNIFSNVFIRLGVGLYAGSLVIQGFFGWPLWACVALLSAIAASYTIVGGLAAVVVTESISANIMILGSIVLTIIGLSKVGGISNLVEQTPPEFWSMLRPANDPEMPWYAIIFGYHVVGIWYWCTDQLIVQRTLCARNLRHGQAGIVFASFLKILPVFIFVLPGVIAYVLHPGLEKADMAYPVILANWLPVGLRGLMVAVLFAAILSTMDAGLNSISTIFTNDIAKKWWPKATDKKLLWIGRIATVCAMVIALIWAPLIGKFPSGLFIVLNQLIAAIAPPLTAVFLFGALWKKTSSKAAKWALWAGEPFCVILTMANALKWPAGFWPEWLNFMFLAFLLLLVMGIFIVIMSLKFPDNEEKQGLVSLKEIYKTPVKPAIAVAAGIIIIVMLTLYTIFN